MRRLLAHGLAMTLVAGFGATQGPNNSEAKPAPTRSVPIIATATDHSAKPKPYQVGTASWYGEDFEGKQTASGEPYDMYDMTAAHLTLPLGSYVRVTNLHNGRAVVVRVNDRGPIVPGRIIDVSYSAAQALQFKDKGLQRVRLDLVHPKTVARQPNPAYPTVAYNRPPVAQLP
jgi:rare lipoprotein A